MELLSGITIENQTLSLDSKHLSDCKIIGCLLEYKGQPVLIERTSFSHCRYLFTGEAGRAVQLLECFGLLPCSQDDRPPS